MKICCVYKIVSPVGKIYVGQTKDFEYRRKSYKRYNCKNQIKLYRSLKKHGFESHSISILEICDSIEMLNEREIYYVKEFDSFNTKHGLNLRGGGRGGSGEWSEDTRNKLRMANLGKKLSIETIQKLKNRTGTKHHNFGRPRTEDTKRKISEANKKYKGKLSSRFGKKLSEETKLKISQANKGKKLSQERVAKMKSIRGKDHPLYGRKRDAEIALKIGLANTGKKRSEEVKQKFRERLLGKTGVLCPNSKVVLQFNIHDELVKQWESGCDITRKKGWSQGNISLCCIGKRKTAYGYKWKYA